MDSTTDPIAIILSDLAAQLVELGEALRFLQAQAAAAHAHRVVTLDAIRDGVEGAAARFDRPAA